MNADLAILSAAFVGIAICFSWTAVLLKRAFCLWIFALVSRLLDGCAVEIDA
jgi:hypothetical protein